MHTGVMDAGWWGVIAVLVIGVAVVGYGWWADRTRDRRAARKPIDATDSSPLPGLTPQQALIRPETLPSLALDEIRRNELRNDLAGQPRLDCRLADPAFITDATTGWAVADNPVVLVSTGPLSAMRELLPAVRQSRSVQRPIVVAAPSFDPDLLATMAANLLQGTVAFLPLTYSEVSTARQLASLTGAAPISIEDLRAGYLSGGPFGHCPVLVADRSESWVFTGLSNLK